MVMNKKTILCCTLFCLLAGLNPLGAQVKKYFIKFKDKNGTPHVISNSNTFLSAKSVNRRVAYNIPTDATDLPVTPAYIAQVENIANVTVLYAIKWLNGVVVSIPSPTLAATALSAINALPFVAGSDQVARLKVNLPQTPSLEELQQQQGTRSAATSTNIMGASYWQNKQLNVPCLHNLGYRGRGMTIAVMDVGFNNVDGNPLFDSLMNRGGVLGTRDFVSGGTSVYEDGSHGAEVLSTMAAIKPYVYMGSAPMADYWLLRTEEGAAETPSEEYNWVRAAEFADSVGADILTTSLGYTYFDIPFPTHTYQQLNGKTAAMSIGATMAARKGLFVLNAAGNEGQSSWQFIAVPGDADSICTVGAVDSLGWVTGFSSIGPTADGRIKPDLVARGGNGWVAHTSGVVFPGNGTSYATPILAGAAACFWQAHREHNNIKLLQLLKSSASNSATPNNTIGWGLVDLCSPVAPLGLNQSLPELQSAFTLAPNPFNTTFTVKFTGHNPGSLTIELTDVSGRMLRSVQPDRGAADITLNMAALPDGIYFVRVSSPSGSSTKKIVKH